MEQVVAEHSINPQNIDANIRKQLLPLMFKECKAVGAGICDSDNNLGLGACLTAISYWKMSIGDNPSAKESAATSAAKRLVIHALTRSAGVNHLQLVKQARDMKSKILNDVGNEGFALFNIPKVDAKVELEHPLVDK